MKISREEKALIKAYVNLKNIKCDGLEERDAAWLEYEITGIIENRNMNYRYMVEDFIKAEIEKLNN